MQSNPILEIAYLALVLVAELQFVLCERGRDWQCMERGVCMVTLSSTGASPRAITQSRHAERSPACSGPCRAVLSDPSSSCSPHSEKAILTG